MPDIYVPEIFQGDKICYKKKLTLYSKFRLPRIRTCGVLVSSLNRGSISGQFAWKSLGYYDKFVWIYAGFLSDKAWWKFI